MKNTMESITVAFKEILSWSTMKYVLISGIIVSAVWIAFGAAIWGFLMAISAKIVEYVPFSMIKSNGAWMLSGFLWLQMVLITFALIYAFFGNIILRKISKDKFASLSVFILIASALFWGAVWFFKGGYIYSQFLRLLNWFPFETVEKSIAFFIAFYLIYNAIIVTMLFVTSIFSEPIIKAVQKRHFNEDEVVRNNTFKSIGYTIKDAVIFTVLSIVLFPLIFVPVLNLFIQIALWIWLVKDTISYDALSLSYQKADKSIIKEHKIAIYFISFITVLFNFVPILNLFSPYFGEIAMFHYFKSLTQNLH